MTSGLSEFALIERFFRRSDSLTSHVSLGIGDDCAVVSMPDDSDLCLSIDTMVEGVHFPKGCDPYFVGYRALATSLSDLAAMGARPSHFTLALTLPASNSEWLSNFAKGLFELADEHQIVLAGGDTTRGPLTISVQVHGFVGHGEAITRSGAQVGDIIAVTGRFGDAGGGLALLESMASSVEQKELLSRYYQPTPRVSEGLALRGKASACIDISDGLVADAGHVARASGCQLNIDIDKIPISKALRSEFSENYLSMALNAGDDYELLFTLSPEYWSVLSRQGQAAPFTEIGYVSSGGGVALWQQGKKQDYLQEGFKHFG